MYLNQWASNSFVSKSLLLQKVLLYGGEGDKQGGDDGREGNGRREQLEVNTLGEGQNQKRE